MSHLGSNLSRVSLFSIAKESELEIDKVHEAEKQGEQSSELGVLQQEVLQGVKDERIKESQVEDDSVTEDTSGSQDPEATDETESPEGNEDPDPDEVDDGTESSTEDSEDKSTDTKETSEKESKEKPEETKESSEDPKEEVASEAFRAFRYQEDEVSLESFERTKKVLGKVASVGYDGIKQVASTLGFLGITYGPKISKALFKGIVLSFVFIGRNLVNGINFLTKYIERRTLALDKLSKDIEIAKQTLQVIQESKAQKDQDSTIDISGQEEVVKFTDEKTINYLKIGETVDLQTNIKTLNKFVTDYVEVVSKAIVSENKLINLAIERSSTLRFPDPVEFLQYNFNLSGFKKVTLSSEHESLIDVFKSRQILPGDVAFIAKLPSRRLQRVKDIKEAYHESDIHLELDKESFKIVEAFNYMTTQELNTFLDSLSDLCQVCISHQKYYEDIKQQKIKSRFSFKRYFDNLLDSDSKVGIEDSFVGNVHIKNVFVDKVYIPSAMDLHDYTAKVISYGLSFAKSNLKHLS